MSGIYLHIPFCKQACHYCNFHFSTSLRFKPQMVDAIVKELELQSAYLQGTVVETIYFGGGTPSLLNGMELEAIFKKISVCYTLADELEITLEANPDDLSLDQLRMLRDTPVNRLSIGIQSFSQKDLSFMNRAHNAEESTACIENAIATGFENLTVDLIYGSPTTSDAQWQENMARVFAYNIPHISCYNLTVEPGTALDHFVKKKIAQPVDEEQSARQLEQLLEASAGAGYIHYEISNFAKEGWYSRHNSAYWQGKPYLGIGPSAHSFNGVARRWNSANNQKYLKAIAENIIPFEEEILTSEQQYNEYLLTGLRTIWGCDIGRIREIGATYAAYFLQMIPGYLQQGTVQESGGIYTLTQRGKFLADRIAMELFYD